MKKLLLIALSTFAVSAHAWEPTFYLGGNLSSSQFKADQAPSDNFTVLSFEGVAGVNLFDFLAVEGRAGAGIGDDSVTNGANTSTVAIDYLASFYVKPYLANDKATLYGLIGYTSVGVDTNDPSLSSEDTADGLGYGVGFTYHISPEMDFIMEWKTAVNADEFDISGGTVGLTYSF